MKNLYLLMGGLLLSPVLSDAVRAESEGVVNVRLFEEEFTFGGCFYGVSENGRYAVGHSREFTALAFIWDRQTDEIKIIEGAYNNLSYAYAVANDGTVVGAYKDESVISRYGEPAIVPGKWRDGVWVPLERIPNSDLFGQGMDGEAKWISPDGRIIGGYVPNVGRKYVPALWIDGVLQPYEGDPVEGQGSFVLTMSDDGAIWGGKAEFECGATSAAIWRDNGKLTRVAGETWDWDVNEYFFYSDVSCISPNGKYACGTFVSDGVSDQRPFIWTEEGGTQYIAQSGACICITDDGTTYGVNGFLGSGIIYKDGQITNLTAYLKDKYEYTDDGSIQYVLGVSKDQSLLAGWNVFNHAMGAIMKPALVFIDGIANNIGSTKADYSVNIGVEGNVISLFGETGNLEVKVYDAVGTCVGTFGAGQQSLEIAGNGVFMVRISGSNGIMTRKVVIK